MTFSNVSLQQDLDAILVGSMQGFNMIWRNVTLAPLDLPSATSTSTASCNWGVFSTTASSGGTGGSGGGAAARRLALLLCLSIGAPLLAGAACCLALALRRRRARARVLAHAQLAPICSSSGTKSVAVEAGAGAGGAQMGGQGRGLGGGQSGGVIQLLARYGPGFLSSISAHHGSATASGSRLGGDSTSTGTAAVAAPAAAEGKQAIAPTPHPQVAAPAREPGVSEPGARGWKRLSSAIGALALDLQERRLAASIAAADSTVAGGGGSSATAQRRMATASPVPSGDLDGGSSVTSGPGGAGGGGGGGAIGQGWSSRESGASGSAPAAPQLQLHDVLGRGTFGQVWRATWKGSTVAVKVRGDRRGRGLQEAPGLSVCCGFWLAHMLRSRGCSATCTPHVLAGGTVQATLYPSSL